MVSLDRSKDLVTMNGTIDVKKMVSYLNPKMTSFLLFFFKFLRVIPLRQRLQLIPYVTCLHVRLMVSKQLTDLD